MSSFGFGATATAQPPAGNLFGASATNTTTGFGGFGTAAKPATSFGGFGASAPATSTSFGGFGATPATSAPAASTTGFGGFGTASAGFGTTPAASTGFGGFSKTSTATTGFGSTPAASNTTTGFGGFGSTGGFGGGAAAAKPATGFGSFGTSTTGGLFGNNTQNSLGLQQNGLGMQAKPQQTVLAQEKTWQKLAVLKAQFDPSSPLCYFRHYFYNMVPPNEVHLYVKPPNQDEQLWNEAVRKNPDPTNLVPVLATGFDDILKRMEIQTKQSELYQEKIDEAKEKIKHIQQQYNLGTLVKLEEHKRRHIHLTQRLLRLLKYSQVLRYKGFPLSAEEERSANEVNQLINDNINPEQLKAKMITLWNQLQSIKAQRSNDEVETWRTVNEEDTQIIAKVLQDNQQGIKHVTNILKRDASDLETIETRLREKRKMK